MIYAVLVIIAVSLLYPGYMLQRNLVKAVSGRDLTPLEHVVAVLPGYNLCIGRTELYGGHAIVSVPMTLFIVLAGFKLLFYFSFNNAAGVIVSLVITIIFYLVVVVTWLILSYVLFDFGRCLRASKLALVLAFIAPPLACYLIGRDCIPKMAMAYAEMEKEDLLG